MFMSHLCKWLGWISKNGQSAKRPPLLGFVLQKFLILRHIKSYDTCIKHLI